MIYVLLNNGFDEIQDISIIEALQRTGAEVKTAGLNGKSVTGINGMKYECDILPSEAELDKAYIIVFPSRIPEEPLDTDSENLIEAAKSNGGCVGIIAYSRAYDLLLDPVMLDGIVHLARELGRGYITTDRLASALKRELDNITSETPEIPKLDDVASAFKTKYTMPPSELLSKGIIGDEDDLESEDYAKKINELLPEFNLKATVTDVTVGPRITRYEVKPKIGTKVTSFVNRFPDFALALGVDGLRIEAPIPGKSAIGFEIPNKHPSPVYLGDLIDSDEFKQNNSKTAFCLGKDVCGNPVIGDIARLPSVIVAGATGMGKSVCINSIITSILYKASPDEVKFIMIDPKKVEFRGYNGIPHLLIPVVTDVKQSVGVLRWAIEEMEARYDLFDKLEANKIDSFNAKIKETSPDSKTLPRIIIVIDELNDIMLQARKPAEDFIMSLTQKARAAGIHLIIGTQRPTVDVLTGVIKANIPSRICCKVASAHDSRVVLDQYGAEKLLNNGDMLYMYPANPRAIRVQGAFISDSDLNSVLKHLKNQSTDNSYDEKVLKRIDEAVEAIFTKPKNKKKTEIEEISPLSDPLFIEGIELALRSGKISTSLLQRKLSIGYSKAAKFIDAMEELGIVTEPNGQKPREVIVSNEEWLKIKDQNRDTRRDS